MSSWMLSMKALLISAGIVFVAMEIKFTFPITVDGIPAMWSAILAWMKPPYLYIIINGIILTIAVTSRFNRNQPETLLASRPEHFISVESPMKPIFEPFSADQAIGVSSVVEKSTAQAVDEIVASEIEDAVAEFKPPLANNRKNDTGTEKEIVVETEVECVSTYNNTSRDIFSTELQSESLLPVTEKPLVSSRFGHRKPIRNSAEASNTRALRVARPKRQETLESTWKMISEGRHVPLTRHQKKPDTWEQQATGPTANETPKSETLKESSRNESTARIRKEPSLSQDELNRRVEAFIKKFNEEMRIQRQESLKQFMEMINRGV